MLPGVHGHAGSNPALSAKTCRQNFSVLRSKHSPAVVALRVMVDLADGRTLIAGVGSFGNRICVENS